MSKTYEAGEPLPIDGKYYKPEYVLVFLDGALMMDVMQANIEEGWLMVPLRDTKGRLQLTEKGDSIKVRFLYGKVEFRLRDDAVPTKADLEWWTKPPLR